MSITLRNPSKDPVPTGASFVTICDATSGYVRVQISDAGDVFPVNSGAFNTMSFSTLRFDAA